MTHFLGIITGYGAAAVLAWLAALLYPRLLPRSVALTASQGWRRAGPYALATLLVLALALMQRRGMLLPQDTLLFMALNQLAVYSPILVYIATTRSRAAVFIPEKHVARSLVIGVILALLGLAAYFSAANNWPESPAFARDLVSAKGAAILWKTLLQSAFIAAFLAFVCHAWSGRIALAVAAAVITALHVPALISQGPSVDLLGLMLVHLALGLGLFSAILVTRNILWFWPVFAVFTVLQAQQG